MIIARFNCPSCETPIEAPANAVAQGVKCPECNVGFVPAKVETSDEAVEPPTGRNLELGNSIPKNRRELLDATREEKAREHFQNEQQAHQAKWREYGKLKQTAEHAAIVSILVAVIGIIALLVGVASLGGYDAHPNMTAFEIASALFGVAFVLFLIAQVMHIRAGLEKLSIKD